jgi:hypothetical protein
MVFKEIRQLFKKWMPRMPKNGVRFGPWKCPKWGSKTVPIGCTRSPFSLRFKPFDTWVWTFGTIYMQSTQWERFT